MNSFNSVLSLSTTWAGKSPLVKLMQAHPNTSKAGVQKKFIEVATYTQPVLFIPTPLHGHCSKKQKKINQLINVNLNLLFGSAAGHFPTCNGERACQSRAKWHANQNNNNNNNNNNKEVKKENVRAQSFQIPTRKCLQSNKT